MKVAIAILTALTACTATAGALEECLARGDQAAVTRCLLDLEKEAQASLNKAEGDAGKRARDIDVATGRSSAAAISETDSVFTCRPMRIAASCTGGTLPSITERIRSTISS